MQSLVVSFRIALATLVVCVGGYTLLILGVGKVLAPDTAEGSMIARADGAIVGSRLVAQKFERPGYFWSRPSAVDYDGAGAGGSNKSPTSTDLVERAKELVTKYGATAERPVPADLIAASGAGLDPHITLRGALYQAERVASARNIDRAKVEALVERHAFAPGGMLAPDRLVNVLELNLALDHELTPGAASR
ncbi:MAG: potassium-transporting ATPase subunit C [Labilithrix sp.]|nr:potassium-transporting ATPase subunit C [Labilithrix sp.]